MWQNGINYATVAVDALKVFYKKKTVSRVLFVLWLGRSLAKARGETQPFISMFLTIILWF